MAFTRENEKDDDGRLVEQCLHGDQGAWEQLLKKHHRVIVSIIRSPKWGFGREELKDLMQEVLEEIVKSLPKYEHQSKLPAYIRAIAFGQCTELLKRKQTIKRTTDRNCEQVDTIGCERENPGAHIPIADGSDPLKKLLHEERVGMLRNALQRLQAECRKLIRMRFFEDLTFSDMAESLGLKENTVAVKLGRCVQKLRPLVSPLL